MGCVWEGGVRNLGRVDPELPHFPDSEQSMAWRPRQGPGMAPPPKGEALGAWRLGNGSSSWRGLKELGRCKPDQSTFKCLSLSWDYSCQSMCTSQALAQCGVRHWDHSWALKPLVSWVHPTAPARTGSETCPRATSCSVFILSVLPSPWANLYSVSSSACQSFISPSC